jgi:hypothetical protein
MQPMFSTLACLLLLALTAVVPQAAAQEARSTSAAATVRAARQAPTVVAPRRARPCHRVKGHSHRERDGRRYRCGRSAIVLASAGTLPRTPSRAAGG